MNNENKTPKISVSKGEYIYLVATKNNNKCHYCEDVCEFLTKENKKYIRLYEDKDKSLIDSLQEALNINHDTWPKIFKIKFCGGCSDLKTYYKNKNSNK